MQTPTTSFGDRLDALLQVAEATKTEETAVRREAATRIAALEKARVRAYRRHHFARLLGDAARRSPDVETALAAQTGAAVERFGWSDEALTPPRQEVLAALGPVTMIVAAIVFADSDAAGDKGALASDAPGDLVQALDTFEAWYGARFEASVWALFDRFTPDLPVTDF